MPGKRKATAKRFGVLKNPRKKRVSVKDLAAAKGRGAKGGPFSWPGSRVSRVSTAARLVRIPRFQRGHLTSPAESSVDRALCEQVPLVCPACRARLEAEGSGTVHGPRLSVAAADVTGSDGELIHGTLACPAAGGCGREYPVLDGIPILVTDLDDYLRNERATILRRRDLPPWADELLDLSLDDADAEQRRARILDAYGAAYPTPPHPLLAPLAEGLPAFLQKCLATRRPAPRPDVIRRGLDAGLRHRRIHRPARPPRRPGGRDRPGLRPRPPRARAGDADRRRNATVVPRGIGGRARLRRRHV